NTEPRMGCLPSLRISDSGLDPGFLLLWQDVECKLERASLIVARLDDQDALALDVASDAVLVQADGDGQRLLDVLLQFRGDCRKVPHHVHAEVAPRRASGGRHGEASAVTVPASARAVTHRDRYSMAAFTQANRQLAVNTPLGKDVLLLAAFSGR